MTDKPDGGPAFPVPYRARYEGMSLRDYFAGQALAGVVGPLVGKEVDDEWVAKCAYRIADAMIAERDK